MHMHACKCVKMHVDTQVKVVNGMSYVNGMVCRMIFVWHEMDEGLELHRMEFDEPGNHHALFFRSMTIPSM